MTSRAERAAPGPGGDGSAHGPGSGRRAHVVGTGLVGGSVGLALRRRGWWVTGADLDPDRAARALALGAVDALDEGLDAELVVVAVPAHGVAAVVGAVLGDPRRHLDVVVTDTSGVKASIVAAVDHPRFVGGHPMAGSEQVGLDGADPDLFVGATWVLTPTEATDLAAFGRLQAVVASLGAEVVVLGPEDHDRLVAMVSHVPHLVAAALMNAAARSASEDAALLRLAAGGFRDMTRVAAGAPGIWPDICADNAPAIVAALDRLLADLAATRAQVAGGDRAGILATLEEASAARRALPGRAARPESLSELRVPVPDRTGVIHELSSVANELGINIYDIEIAHSAEGGHGLCLLLVERDRADALHDAFAARGYRASVRDLG